MDETREETREEYIRRLAYNRWDLRQQFKFRLNETDKDDWYAAEKQVEREEARKLEDER